MTLLKRLLVMSTMFFFLPSAMAAPSVLRHEPGVWVPVKPAVSAQKAQAVMDYEPGFQDPDSPLSKLEKRKQKALDRAREKAIREKKKQEKEIGKAKEKAKDKAGEPVLLPPGSGQPSGQPSSGPEPQPIPTPSPDLGQAPPALEPAPQPNPSDALPEVDPPLEPNPPMAEAPLAPLAGVPFPQFDLAIQQMITNYESRLAQLTKDLAGELEETTFLSSTTGSRLYRSIERLFYHLPWSLVGAAQQAALDEAERLKTPGAEDRFLALAPFTSVLSGTVEMVRRSLLQALPQAFPHVRVRVQEGAEDHMAYTNPGPSLADLMEVFFPKGVEMRFEPVLQEGETEEAFNERRQAYRDWGGTYDGRTDAKGVIFPTYESYGAEINALAKKILTYGFQGYGEHEAIGNILTLADAVATITAKAGEAAEILRKIAFLRTAPALILSGDVTQKILYQILVEGRNSYKPVDKNELAKELLGIYLAGISRMTGFVDGSPMAAPMPEIDNVEINAAEKAQAAFVRTNSYLGAVTGITGALSSAAMAIPGFENLPQEVAENVKLGSAPYGIQVTPGDSLARESLNDNLRKQLGETAEDAIRSITAFNTNKTILDPVQQTVFELSTKAAGSKYESERVFQETLFYGPEANQYISVGADASASLVLSNETPLFNNPDSKFKSFGEHVTPLGSVTPMSSAFGIATGFAINGVYNSVTRQTNNYDIDFKIGTEMTNELSIFMQASVKSGATALTVKNIFSVASSGGGTDKSRDYSLLEELLNETQTTGQFPLLDPYLLSQIMAGNSVYELAMKGLVAA